MRTRWRKWIETKGTREGQATPQLREEWRFPGVQEIREKIVWLENKTVFVQQNKRKVELRSSQEKTKQKSFVLVNKKWRESCSRDKNWSLGWRNRKAIDFVPMNLTLLRQTLALVWPLWSVPPFQLWRCFGGRGAA